MALQIRRLSYALGAEITGLDLGKPLDDKTLSEVYAAFLEHCVLVFRGGPPITQEQHIAFSRQFGILENNEKSPRDRHPEYPEIMMVSNKVGSLKGQTEKYSGQFWHSDQSFTLIPAMASLLRGVEIPDVGGDTMFSNMYLAYETLSDGMKKLIEGLHGVHVGGQHKRVDNSSPERLAETQHVSPPIAQPLVRVHPETGRKTLYVAERIKLLVGMTAEESKPLIDFLCQHATRPQFIYRHQWRKDDLIMWDNRCLNHLAANDYDKTQARHMERTIVLGTPSGYVYESPLH